MGVRIDDKLVRGLTPPPSGNRIVYDDPKQGPRGSEGVSGFGVRITAAGARSWVLNYRNAEGRERRHTIGRYPEISVEAARRKAKELRSDITLNKSDPRAERKAKLEAPRMSDLCDYYIEHHLPEKRSRPAADDKAMIAEYIRPKLGAELVSEMDKPTLAKFHRSIGKPYRANRVLALVSTMLSLATSDDLKWRSTNPAKDVKRNPEEKRERFLKGHEIARLKQALDDYPDQEIANIVRLLLGTGARRGEVLTAQWSQFDLESGIWVKPAATTKQKKLHRVHLSRDMKILLTKLYTGAPRDDLGRLKSKFLFPAPRTGEPRSEIKDEWRSIALAAGLFDEHPPARPGGKPTKVVNCRLHDLRHTYASILASDGESLPIIGKLLGHTQVATTQRYAHLYDEQLLRAADRAAEILAEAKPSKVISIRGDAA